jgi:hypothetical protein
VNDIQKHLMDKISRMAAERRLEARAIVDGILDAHEAGLDRGDIAETLFRGMVDGGLW